MTKSTKPALNLTIGVEYINKGKSDTIKLGSEFRPRGQVNSLDRQAFSGTMFQSTGIPMTSQPVIKQTTTVGSGAFGIQTQGYNTTCSSPNYPLGVLDSGNGYMYLQNLEPAGGNILHWGVAIGGAVSTIDFIDYQDFAVVGMLNPGEQSLFRLNPSGPIVKFVSSSGVNAFNEAGATKQARPTRFTYTIFPR